MELENRFPPELLNASKEEKLKHFKDNANVLHKNLKQVHKEVMRAFHEPAGAIIIFVIGPSGVGKSTERRYFEKELMKEVSADLEKDPGFIPFLSIEAIAPGAGLFKWKDLYKRALIALDEMLIEHKVDYDLDGVKRNREGKLVISMRASEHALRLALESALRMRKALTVLVDEMQHIGKGARDPEILKDHMDCIKSIVNHTNIPWIVFGTYDLRQFLNLSPQLSRRSLTIHFARYQYECKEDREEFRKVLRQFLYHMPLQESPLNLLPDLEFFYERTIGCIGTLKDWLTRAFALALEEKATNLTFEHLHKTAHTVAECVQMARDATEGEAMLTDNPKTHELLKLLLGLEASQTGTTIDSKQQQQDARSRSKRRVGERNPGRDPVGSGSIC